MPCASIKKSRTILYKEVAIKQALLLACVVPILFSLTFEMMKEMDNGSQSSLFSVIGLLMAAAIVGLFEATYQKTRLEENAHRFLAHCVKFLLFTGITQLMLLAIATIGTTAAIYDDPLLWALVPIYISLYLFDWWDIKAAIVND
ncbi:TPA: hypothetical protein ACGU7T_000018 [Vibrio vulnificus]